MSSAPLVRVNQRVGDVALATDVYRPDTEQPVPTVLIRTCSGKSVHLDEALAWARNGFACVVQDVRGRFDSDGQWWPYLDERKDAETVLAWLAEQSWCDGRVVACGSSYSAFTAWTAAVAAPQLVRAVISIIPAMGLHKVKFDPSGVLRLAEHAGWWLTFGDSRTNRPGLTKAMLEAAPDLLAYLPVCGLADHFWAELPSWNGVIEDGDDSQAWHIPDSELAHLPTPALHIGGWHDLLISETLHQWRIVGSAVQPRPLRGMIVGPWNQQDIGWARSTRHGDREFGPQSRVALGRLMVDWTRRALGDVAPRPAEQDVRVFVMGANRWATGSSWPTSPTQPTVFYAAAGHRLGTDVAEGDGSDEFTYDPLDPFPSRLLPVDRADLDKRRDAVRYISAPLDTPMTIAGSPRVILHATTDAVDTDWVVRLIEGFADGRRIAVTQGCVNAARRGHALGRSNRYEIDMTPTCLTVPAGHTIELEVTSSDFPILARNLNTGRDRYATTRTAIAHQSIHFGIAAPTALILPTQTDT